MRWSECFIPVITSLNPDIEIKYEPNEEKWNGKDENIYVIDGQKELRLWDYIDSLKQSPHELLKDHIMLVTRIFDNRVKSFIKHILMGAGEDKIPVTFYSYRVEFQGKPIL